MTKFTYYGKTAAGLIVEVMSCFQDEQPTGDQVKAWYHTLAAQNKQAGMPPLTMMTAVELVELDEEIPAPSPIVWGTGVQLNGKAAS